MNQETKTSSVMDTRDYHGWVSQVLQWLFAFSATTMMVVYLLVWLIHKGEFNPTFAHLYTQVCVWNLLIIIFKAVWLVINSKPGYLPGSAVLAFISNVAKWVFYLATLICIFMVLVLSTSRGKLHLFGFKLEVPFDRWGEALFSGKEAIFDNLLFFQCMQGAAGLWLLFAVLVSHFYLQDDTLRRWFFGYRPAYATAAKGRRTGT